MPADAPYFTQIQYVAYYACSLLVKRHAIYEIWQLKSEVYELLAIMFRLKILLPDSATHNIETEIEAFFVTLSLNQLSIDYT
jgi:hypothetical protein